MTSDIQYAIGVDLGATKIAVALVARDGQVLAEERALTEPARGVPHVIGAIARCINALRKQTPGPLVGIGIGTPGYVDPQAGIVQNAVNLGWEQVAIAELVSREFDDSVRVWVDNDANVQALGEYTYGAAKGCDPFVCVSIGSGLGGGIFVNGHLLSGATHTAAEMGHFSLDPDGQPCVCGLRGCAETVVSGPGMVATLRRQIQDGIPSPALAGSSDFTPEQIVLAARQNDPAAQATVAETARWLGAVFAIYVATINPQRIVVGGGLGHSAYDLLVPPAQIELRRRVVPQAYAKLDFARSQVASSAAGAAALAWHNQFTG